MKTRDYLVLIGFVLGVSVEFGKGGNSRCTRGDFLS